MSQLTDDILSHLDIVDVVSKYVPLKRAGANFTACCPFHNEKTPSFMVSPAKQIFKCFGCGKGWNVLTFVQEIERIDFRDAVKELAKLGNINLEKYQLDRQKVEDYADEKEKIKRMHTLAQQFFTDELKKNIHALTYLREQRKLDDKAIKYFGIGYAPESHYALLQFLKSKGFNDNDLIQASLAKKGQNQDIYSFFRHRITFPIYDTMQNVIGFSARIVDPNDKPKYLNSAEHKAYDKSSVLYGLNRVKNNVKMHTEHSGQIIIVEGQMDVVGLTRLGFPIGVATSGTSLTEQHIKLLKRYTDNLYLLFDSDQAGQAATIRALSIAYQNDIFPKKITLPAPAKDADDLANVENGAELFKEQFENAQDGFTAVFENLQISHNLKSPIDKQKILNTMFGLIININSVPMQDHYLHILGEKLNLAYEVLLPQYKQYAKNDGKFITRQMDKKSATKTYQPDREELVNALFEGGFINTYVQTPELRSPLIDLMQKLPSKVIETQDLSPLQLRREKELEDKNESRQLQVIKQIIGKTLQFRIQQILKDKNISNDDKQSLLKLKKILE